MADRVWGAGSGGGSDGLWSTAANWTGDTKPQAGEAVIFNNTYTGVCTVDEATPELASLLMGGTAGGVYSGTITASNKVQMTGNFTIEAGCTGTWDNNADIDIDGNFTVDGGTILAGTAKNWTMGGTFDIVDIGTFTRETSTIVMNGEDTSLLTGTTNNIYGLTVNTSITFTGHYVYGPVFIAVGKIMNASNSNNSRAYNAHTINGTLTCGTGNYTFYPGSSVIIGASGTVSGSTSYFYGGGAFDNSAGGSLSFSTSFTFYNSPSIKGTYDGTIMCRTSTANTIILAGDVTFTGSVGFLIATDSVTYQVSPSNYNLTFRGNVTFTQTAGTLQWNKGTGSITLSGTSNQTITTPAGWTQILEDITITKTAGSVTLTGDIYTDSLTFNDGDLNLAGYDIYSNGNVDINGGNGLARFLNASGNANMGGGVIYVNGGTLTLDGVDGYPLIINNLNFNLAENIVGTAVWCNVQCSVVIYVLKDAYDGRINATNRCVNNGDTIGWRFSVPDGIRMIASKGKVGTGAMNRGRMRQRPQSFKLNYQHPLAQGLVFASLGNLAGSLKCFDSSLYGNHGTLTNMDPATDWVWDKTLNRFMLDYDGANDQVVVTDKSYLSGMVCLSISAWVYIRGSGGATYGRVISKSDTAVYAIVHESLKLWVYVNGIATGATTGTLTIPGLYHVAGFYDGAYITAYLNGIPGTPVAKTGIVATTASSLIIGNRSSDSARGWNGLITDILISSADLRSWFSELADPSNVDLNGLIYAERKWWPVGAPTSTGKKIPKFLYLHRKRWL